MKIKKKNRHLGITLSILLNIFFYLIIIFVTLFIVSFDWQQLLPRWEIWHKLPVEEAGKWFWQKGYTEIVPKGTPGAYFAPGVLIISGIVNIIGFLLFFNTRWGKKLKLTLEKLYLKNVKTISEYNYLISDEDFAKRLFQIDRRNKIEAWRAIMLIKYQKHLDKIPNKVQEEMFLPEEQHSKRTKNWIKRREEYKQKLDNKWIEENLHLLRIRYPKINARMIINGVDDLKISRMAITDVKVIERKETGSKIVTTLLIFTLVSIFTALTFPSFRQDVWMVIKDYIIYTGSLMTNIIMGNMSAQLIHDARIRETEDRKGYIKDYVGEPHFIESENRVVRRMKAEEVEDLRNRLFMLEEVTLQEVAELEPKEEIKKEQE